MMQQDNPEDFVLATGVTTSVRDFITMAFEQVGITLLFTGEAEEEKAFVDDCNNPLYQLPKGKQVVGIHPRYFRPTEVDLLIGDATKAYTQLGWKPKYNLQMMIKEMMEDEIKFQAKK